MHYFSSAGNQGQQQAWQSPVRLLPKSAAANTNLDFSDVDPDLYDGGLQDADPGPGTDVAQTVTLGEGGGRLDVQWDDPFDPNGASFGPAYFTATGNITAANPSPSFSFTPKANQVGKLVQFRTDAIPSGTTDLILTVTAPDGTDLGTIDTGSSPEVLVTRLKAGTYTITVEGFEGETGDITVDVRPVSSPSKVSTDFNVLLFATNGAFLGALADVNPVTGRPIELTRLAGLPQIQMVISRSGTGPVGASTIRAVGFEDLYFTEYSNPFAPSVFGHHAAAGGSAVAAYDTFKPYLPEYFTSPGGHLPIYFDSDGTATRARRSGRSHSSRRRTEETRRSSSTTRSEIRTLSRTSSGRVRQPRTLRPSPPWCSRSTVVRTRCRQRACGRSCRGPRSPTISTRSGHAAAATG